MVFLSISLAILNWDSLVFINWRKFHIRYRIIIASIFKKSKNYYKTAVKTTIRLNLSFDRLVFKEIFTNLYFIQSFTNSSHKIFFINHNANPFFNETLLLRLGIVNWSPSYTYFSNAKVSSSSPKIELVWESVF